ncbi:MAG: molybdenum cofactor biosynthesis protein MoaE [Dehalococcoidia bacterium]|nr:MAG: molybdenum cofactor biosynthesis protein MoaE [Chloroflexota bacterium]|tara:strand:+ start:22590 stop:23027 length:438 start_codon:yes stop_codon:yes gene_type:complete
MKDNKKFEIILTNDLLEVNDFIKTDFGTIDGSEVIFLGITRDNNFDRNVSKLFYESYQDMAIIEIEKIIYDIFNQWQISFIKVTHRLGEVFPSELSMILSVKSKHRKESFEASQYFVDELKKTVPIWKKEFFEDGTVWINDKIVE